MEGQSSLTDLPLEILMGIAPYLDPVDFVSLCRTCHLLHDTDELFYSARYWSEVTRRMFRVRNRPVIEGDGRRWMQLYRRMRTQTKLYTWGNNDGGCLGGDILGLSGRPGVAPRPTRHGPQTNSFLDPQCAAWPRETSMGNVGVIADMQCGGWSTTVLNSQGALATAGYLANTGFVPSPVASFHEYPAGYTSPANSSGRYDPYTAIQQFSAGRTHVLGLSDTGRIWSWSSSRRPGRQVKFFSHETYERTGPGTATKFGFVKQVVAGWDRSTAHIIGVGIVVWEPGPPFDLGGTESAETDTIMVLRDWIVPNTDFRRRAEVSDDLNEHETYLADRVGEVTSYTVLEHYILFATDLGKLFLWRKQEGSQNVTPDVVVELLVSMKDDPVVDVQGSFRSFAVFTKSGAVLTGTRESLDQFADTHPTLQGETTDIHLAHPLTLTKIPCLQHNSVISMAFGDYHSHALHADGTISSYGHEPKFCGALGLGGDGDEVVRGVRALGFGRDGKLLPQCYTTGRRVHFEPEKQQWLNYLRLGDVGRREAEERISLTFEQDAMRAEVSEWFEARLRGWENGGPSPDKLPTIPSTAADGLPAYFALTVAAAGWHSGALVLVNEAKAARTRASYRVPLPSDYKEYVPIFEEPRPYHLTSGGSTALLSPAPGADAQRPPLQRNPSSSLLERAADGVRWVFGAQTRSNGNQGGSRSRTPSPAVGDGAPQKTLEERARQIDEDKDAAREKWLGPRKWAWEGEETFPRLMLANGETMPGQGPVDEWPEGTAAPVWREVEVVQI